MHFYATRKATTPEELNELFRRCEERHVVARRLFRNQRDTPTTGNSQGEPRERPPLGSQTD